MFANASIVARTTLIGLVEPYALERTLRTPATSNTARIAPPAMIPVPSLAGCINTREPVCTPLTGCCNVPSFKATLIILRRAFSIAFWIAAGTSRALP